ncbi:MAG TPA: hypothetical protein VHO72_15795 [Bacteroidales bacterium]|nr:hypothetical protein [Bacteroidales bacterium]
MAYSNKKRIHNVIPIGQLIAGLLFCMLLPTGLSAQNLSIHHPQLQYLFEDSLLQLNSYHTLFKPVEIPWQVYDSVMHVNKDYSSQPVRISPVLDASFSYRKEGNDLLYQFGQGVYASGKVGKKAGFELSAVLYEQKFGDQENTLLQTYNLVPGHNRYLWRSGSNTGYLSIRGYAYWRPLKWLTLKAGNDKQFIGDGGRSFIFSENAAAYPFLQTRLNIWKINYTHQVMFMRDVIPDSGALRFSKYATMHTLSINATKRLNLYIFEAVVWRAQDSVRHRTFDVTYLNPFLFFRPVEFNMGSPDNVLMGIGGKWIIGKQSFLYGQFMLDEFKLKEIKANNGWWSNKFAYQMGFKTFGLFKKYKSVFLAEYNHCRPFTYAHTYTTGNYGYLYRPLAHPMGSNFRELYMQFGISLPKQWFVDASASLSRYGTDPQGTNYGSDLYKRQYTYTKPYGNTTAQGIVNNEATLSLNLSRLIKPEWRLRVFANLQSTLHRSGGITGFYPAFSVGINTWMYENN